MIINQPIFSVQKERYIRNTSFYPYEVFIYKTMHKICKFPYLTGKGLITFLVAYFLTPSSSPCVLGRLGVRQLEHIPPHHPSPCRGCAAGSRPPRQTRAGGNAAAGYPQIQWRTQGQDGQLSERARRHRGNAEDVGFAAARVE